MSDTHCLPHDYRGDGECPYCATKEQADTGKALPPNAGKGRPKGALNKTTRAAKEAIAFAAEGLGGAERLVEWAQEDPQNERAFWTSIYPKLLPLQVAGDPDNPLRVEEIRRVIVDPRNA
jgi:hypothetical protein